MADTGATAFDIEYFAFKKKHLTDIRPVPLKTRWLTPAGLCISKRKFGAFSSRPSAVR
jgi:hypothetical protein